MAARLALLSATQPLAERERWLHRLARWLPRVRHCTVGEAVWAVTAVARRIPGTRCLAWSLALRALLAQSDIRSQLRIGVAQPEPGMMTAHAWLESGGHVLSFGTDVEPFKVLLPRMSAS